MNQISRHRRIAFERIASTATARAPDIVRRWLPDGRQEGSEWVARNPLRSDRHLGSLKVNLRTGRWADFATNDRGGDLISLAAYLFALPMKEAAEQVANMLGVELYE